MLLNKSQQKVLNIIKENTTITSKEIHELISDELKLRSVMDILTFLKRNKILDYDLKTKKYNMYNCPDAETISKEIEYDNELTVDKIYDMFKIDKIEWDVNKIIGNQWGDKKQLKLEFKKRKIDSREKALKWIAEYSPKEVEKIEYNAGNKLGIISIYDHHFGKYCWKDETGNDYDLKIAADIFKAAVDESVIRLSDRDLSEIVIPIGSDLLHIDNDAGTTTGGTSLDVDTRLAKIFEIGSMCCIDLIDKAKQLAPIKVIGVGSNHDKHAGYYLCQVLQAWFRNDPNVTFDVGPKDRKYFIHGKNLIGFCHGDGIKPETLARIIMSENKSSLGQINFIQWLTGHFHKSKQTNYLCGDSLDMIELKVLPSLCGTDSWHNKHGFISGNRACKIFTYDSEYGPETEETIYLKNIYQE